MKDWLRTSEDWREGMYGSGEIEGAYLGSFGWAAGVDLVGLDGDAKGTYSGESSFSDSLNDKDDGIGGVGAGDSAYAGRPSSPEKPGYGDTNEMSWSRSLGLRVR